MREIQRAFRANQVTHGRSFATSDRTFIGAPVAELVDAQVSGTCDRKVVEVQVLSGAPIVTVVEPPLLARNSFRGSQSLNFEFLGFPVLESVPVALYCVGARVGAFKPTLILVG